MPCRQPPLQQTQETMAGTMAGPRVQVGADGLSWCHPDLRADLATAAVSSHPFRCKHKEDVVKDKLRDGLSRDLAREGSIAPSKAYQGQILGVKSRNGLSYWS
jgi:hypothetical protein